MFTTRKVTAEIFSIVGAIRHEFTSGHLESFFRQAYRNFCVDACLVDCIHPKKNTTYDDGRPTFDRVPQLYIDRVECIDCGASVPVCPVSAIFALDDLPEKWKQYTELNESYVKAGNFTPEQFAKHQVRSRATWFLKLKPCSRG